jgi:hypothetical protein
MVGVLCVDEDVKRGDIEGAGRGMVDMLDRGVWSLREEIGWGKFYTVTQSQPNALTPSVSEDTLPPRCSAAFLPVLLVYYY